MQYMENILWIYRSSIDEFYIEAYSKRAVEPEHNGPYQNGPNQNEPYQNGPPPNGPYQYKQNGPFQNGPAPNRASYSGMVSNKAFQNEPYYNRPGFTNSQPFTAIARDQAERKIFQYIIFQK